MMALEAKDMAASRHPSLKEVSEVHSAVVVELSPLAQQLAGRVDPQVSSPFSNLRNGGVKLNTGYQRIYHFVFTLT